LVAVEVFRLMLLGELPVCVWHSGYASLLGKMKQWVENYEVLLRLVRLIICQSLLLACCTSSASSLEDDNRWWLFLFNTSIVGLFDVSCIVVCVWTAFWWRSS
jgi:hypothetical protein